MPRASLALLLSVCLVATSCDESFNDIYLSAGGAAGASGQGPAMGGAAGAPSGGASGQGGAGQSATGGQGGSSGQGGAAGQGGAGAAGQTADAGGAGQGGAGGAGQGGAGQGGAGQGGAGMGGSVQGGAQQGGAGQGGAGQGGAGQGGAAGQAGMSGMAGAGGACSQGETRCEQGSLEQCDAGAFVAKETCALGCNGKVCAALSSLSLGAAYSLALSDNGEVWAWGAGSKGQLGLGAADEATPKPTRVTALSGIAAIGAGDEHACALTAAGALSCWGRNDKGQASGKALGEGKAQLLSPEGVTTIAGARQLALGASHGCLRTDGGDVHCWGLSNQGQAGVQPGTQINDVVPTPGKVALASKALDLAASAGHSMAVVLGGAVYAWGNGTFEAGQPAAPQPTPAIVAGLINAATVAVGDHHFCARTGSGKLLCGGGNELAQLGRDGTSPVETTPLAPTQAAASYVEVAAGLAHTCAMQPAGQISCWGASDKGQAGPQASPVTKPADVAGVSAATHVYAGAQHSCAIVGKAAIKCWGDNAFGQLGRGDRDPASGPVDVAF